jgi:hypothetical protein
MALASRYDTLMLVSNLFQTTVLNYEMKHTCLNTCRLMLVHYKINGDDSCMHHHFQPGTSEPAEWHHLSWPEVKEFRWEVHIHCFLGHEEYHSDRYPAKGIHNKQKNILQFSEGEPEANH